MSDPKDPKPAPALPPKKNQMLTPDEIEAIELRQIKEGRQRLIAKGVIKQD